MKNVTKLLIVLFCISVCAGGTVLSVKGSAKDNRAKTNVVPINNRATKNRIWIWS